MSANLYSDLIFGFALENYPKIIFRFQKSVHCIRSYWDVFIKSYGDIFLHVSWCVQWPQHWGGLKKLPLDQTLWRCLFPCQLMIIVTSLLDWPWKTTPKRLLNCQNPSTESEVKELSFSMSADMYSDLTIGLALKKYPKMTLKLPKSIHWFKRYSEINFYIS